MSQVVYERIAPTSRAGDMTNASNATDNDESTYATAATDKYLDFSSGSTLQTATHYSVMCPTACTLTFQLREWYLNEWSEWVVDVEAGCAGGLVDGNCNDWDEYDNCVGYEQVWDPNVNCWPEEGHTENFSEWAVSVSETQTSQSFAAGEKKVYAKATNTYTWGLKTTAVSGTPRIGEFAVLNERTVPQVVGSGLL